jgi:hypothetical protein
MNPYKELRRKEYLHGTRSWDVSLTNGDHVRFNREYVVPLRQLNQEGIFGSFDAPEFAVDATNVAVSEVVVS